MKIKILAERPPRTKFVGNINTKEIHRLDAENKDGNGCQIDRVIKSKHAVNVQNPLKAIREGWDVCAKCWGVNLSER